MSDTQGAKSAATKTLLQQLAECDGKRAQIVDDINKKRARGLVLVGSRLIFDAKTDERKAAYLREIVATAEQRNREAIEIACKTALATAASQKETD